MHILGFLTGLFSIPWHILAIYVGTYSLLGSIQYLFIRFAPIGRYLKHTLLTVPTAIVAGVFWISFPTLRTITVIMMAAWSFANFFVNAIEKDAKQDEKRNTFLA